MKMKINKSSLLLAMLLFSHLLFFGQISQITGTVYDDVGVPLPGATVLVKGTTNGTTTDFDGNFSINASSSDVLIVSYIGFSKTEVVIGDKNSFIINLEASTETLDEVVLVGYGVQRKKDVTGAVSTVKAEDLNTTNAVTIENLLQGQAAGLNVTAGTAQPGGALNITIRGAISPNGDNSPLYVIDGLPISNNSSTEFNSAPEGFRGGFARSPLANINPNDIESVDILKDASATAIYGSAASNGVILITTKKGKAGKTTVNFSSSFSIQTAKEYLRPLNATEFRRAANDFGAEQLRVNNQLAPYGNGTTPISGFTPFFSDGQIQNAGVGTDYIDFVVRDGTISDQNVSITSGNENTKIFTSFNFFEQKALLVGSNFKRLSGRINLDQKLGSKINFRLGVSYNNTKSDNVATGQSNDIDSPSLLQSALQFAPDISPFDENGNTTIGYNARTPNPASYSQITNQNLSTRVILTPSLKFDLSDAINLNIVGGIDNTSTERRFFVPVAANFLTVPEGNAQLGNTRLGNYSAETFLNFNNTYGDHRISAVIGAGYYKNTFSDYGLEAIGFPTDIFGLDNIGIANNRLQSSVSSNRGVTRIKLSQFTRLNYTLKNKYIFQFTGRFDASSNFPENNKVGFFPGISAGWVASEENFMKDITWFPELKFRAGYGTTGNESITANNIFGSSLYALTTDFSYLIGNQLNNSGFIQTQLGNPDLKWETNITINAGIDFALLKNRRITGSIDYFQRTAEDLLDFRTLPSSNANTLQVFNVGSTRSTGIEVSLRTENIITENFSWSSLFTFGTARTFWLERNPGVELAEYIGDNDAINAVYGWKTNGLIRTADDIPDYQPDAFVGNVKYVDLNGDGQLNIEDVTNLGDLAPRGTFGINNNIRFKNFDLAFQIYGAYGNLTFDGFQTFAQPAIIARQGLPTNVEATTLDVFTSFNPDGIYPGFAPDVAGANNPTGVNDFRTVENSFFARLKNVNFGYSVPMDNVKLVQSLRLFMNFDNLFFLTNTRGLDPEMERNNNPYPMALTSALGLSVQF
ncbi:SusC/RagA family TonB-linked outer membrane protein [Costertonia aggregata]|uniref:SusC/RagA family TonB-linked outer membrane protein n=1 Tax=Costertonia aggregata TaxID=343403 RepID=A0A7H9ANP4_9FLAO|nr:SusC/RagA family TonB-linked outer membrane protein [Costertonia aggregata]QLG45081.1 SusC/RagA family TonB-linked outer membrane protein [Costertonia aggregata]